MFLIIQEGAFAQENARPGEANAYRGTLRATEEEVTPGPSNAPRKVLFEEFTGEWCSLCPGGTIEMDRALRAFAGRVVPISYHDNDPLEMTGLNALLDSIPFDPLYPGGTFDRYPYSIDNPKHKMSVERFDFLSTLGKAASNPAYTSIAAAVSIDRNARRLTADVRVEFLEPDTGDFRIQCMVTESGIRRDGMQRNAFDKDSISYPQLFGAGDPLRTWVHDYVARAMLGGTAGRSGVIPGLPVPGTAYTTTFSYAIPASFDIDEIGVAVFASRYRNKSIIGNEVLNAEGYLGSVITEIVQPPAAPRGVIDLYPNPCHGIAYLRAASEHDRPVEVGVFDMMGRRVRDARVVAFADAWQLDLRDLPAGSYHIRYHTAYAVHAKRVLVR